jgi:hypothetical protein
MKKAVVTVLLLAFVCVFPFQTAYAMPNVHIDYTKTTITLHETVNFTAQVSYPANITWYCDDINVQSEFSTFSCYTFIPKAVGVYFVKLSVDGFTNPPPIGAIKVTVIEYAYESPPFQFVTPWVWESPPKLTIESPINGTYAERAMLKFTVEAPNNWFNNQSENWNDFNLKNTAIEQKLVSISYVLDGNLITIPVDSNLCLPYHGSIELANLTEGTHQLIVYINATGVYRSFRGFFAQTQINDTRATTVVFNFIPPSAPSLTPSTTPPPTLKVEAIALVSMIIGVVAVASLLAYFKKRKRVVG